MNVVNVRERLKEARYLDGTNSDTLSQAVECPIFEYDDEIRHPFTPDELEFLGDNVFDMNLGVPIVTPFPAFILSGKRMSILWGKENAEQWWFLAVINDHRGYFLRGHLNRKERGRHDFWIYRRWKLIESAFAEKEFSVEEREEFVNFPRTMLAHFLLDVMNPANAVVQVQPNKPMKSAVWQRSRTHYLIIPKRTARRAQTTRGAPQVDVQLAAHWRRGHLRRLMSEKFKHKRGQLVAVRQAWVGPTEWIGFDQKIYKVMP